MLRHLVIISDRPYNIRSHQNYYIKEFLKNNIHIDYIFFNIHKYSDNGIECPENSAIECPENLSLIKFERKKELNDFFFSLDLNKFQVVMLYDLPIEVRFLFIFRFFHRKKITYLRILRGTLPYIEHKSWIHKLFIKINSGGFIFSIRNFLSVKLNKLAITLINSPLLQSPLIEFIAGEKTFSPLNSRKININYFDYDIFLEEADKNKENKVENYFVFLDQNLVSHPDHGKHSSLKSYYDDLKNFFNYLEINFNTKVKIALHPTSNKETNSLYAEFESSYETYEMVANSKGVIAHFSTAISYAVIHKKPILSIYSDEFIHPSLDMYLRYINKFSKELNTKLININDLNHFEIPKVSTLEYSKFVINYLSSVSTKKTNSAKIILREIKKIFQSDETIL